MQCWGRLTLQSGKPRMDENVSSSTIYYTPYENCNKELKLELSTQPNNLYDVYLTKTNNLILTSPWLNKTRPSIDRIKKGGLYFNSDNELYLGTIYTSDNNKVKWEIRPQPRPYGCNNELGIFNAYNRLPFVAVNRDTTSEWIYGNDGLRYANNSNLFRINWVDGLGDVFCEGQYQSSISPVDSRPAAATIGVGLNQDTYPINWDGYLQQSAGNNQYLGVPIMGMNWTNGKIGRNSWQAMEQSTHVPIRFYGNNFSCLIIRLEV